MSQQIDSDKILVLDFGGQYAQLIARRVREAGVFCQVLPCDASVDDILDSNPKGVILSGGPESAYELDSLKIPEVIFSIGCPILGICYGLQLLAASLGGSVVSGNKEHGHTDLFVAKDSWVKDILGESSTVWMSHNDEVENLPENFVSIAHTSRCKHAIIADFTRSYFGFQFHPEVTHTVGGFNLIKHFVLNICDCDALWSTSNIKDYLINEIKDKVGKDKVVLGLSGGVDSAVVAALLHHAIGSQMTAIFVDNGLLRLGEAAEVESIFSNFMGINLIKIDASNQFLDALSEVTDPEDKRRIIGQEFVHIFQEQAAKLKGVKWLAQGTIYPDVIESAGAASGKAHVIKSHHNVGGLPASLNLSLLEPLRSLFKDEVRKLGAALDLPNSLLHRHPFPGPGLAVRIIGKIDSEALRINREADDIFIQTLKKYNWYHRVSQAFVVFLPIKSVGVVGDNRAYSYVVSLRAVETSDFMTATAAELPYGLLSEASTRIVNEVKGVSRVVYDITSKPPATIEWE
jgi:GMP synthase (glutamine-hydrolysing)